MAPKRSAPGSSKKAPASKKQKKQAEKQPVVTEKEAARFEEFPQVPEMNPKWQPDLSLYRTILNDEGDEEEVYMGPHNAPTVKKTLKVGVSRWLSKEYYQIYLKWSNPNDKENYRNVLGGKFIKFDLFIETGLAPLIEKITNMGFIEFVTLDNFVEEDLIRQFYTNLYEDNHHFHSIVKDKVVTFKAEDINRLVNAKDEGSEYFLKGEWSPLVDFNRIKDEWFPTQPLTSVYKLKMTHFKPIHRILYALISEIFCPVAGHKRDMTHFGLHWLAALWFGKKINLGKFVCNYMMEAKREKRHTLPYGRLIMRLIQDKGGDVDIFEDVGSNDLIGPDYLKQQGLILVDSKWLYRQSKIKGPNDVGASTEEIYNDTKDPDLGRRMGKRPIGESSETASSEDLRSMNLKIEALSLQMNNMEETMADMKGNMATMRNLIEEIKMYNDFQVFWNMPKQTKIHYAKFRDKVLSGIDPNVPSDEEQGAPQEEEESESESGSDSGSSAEAGGNDDHGGAGGEPPLGGEPSGDGGGKGETAPLGGEPSGDQGGDGGATQPGSMEELD